MKTWGDYGISSLSIDSEYNLRDRTLQLQLTYIINSTVFHVHKIVREEYNTKIRELDTLRLIAKYFVQHMRCTLC